MCVYCLINILNMCAYMCILTPWEPMFQDLLSLFSVHVLHFPRFICLYINVCSPFHSLGFPFKIVTASFCFRVDSFLPIRVLALVYTSPLLARPFLKLFHSALSSLYFSFCSFALWTPLEIVLLLKTIIPR